ncbi:hypothetical protein FF011L_09000 [Roseimaritima multifibrata]|uniref:VWFA domain-containing protein n=1 Tax=Roseimaritima multifibrata TaxID=1930274 RepID=A0A517MB92_9BACT|nr:VWA domain-containing protein [Roseimaritima multifibrata]QDS92163.1 hypothetical protein FF011L_09000 [Roseimaritima multifibrata]
MTLLNRDFRVKVFKAFPSVSGNLLLGVCFALIVGASAVGQESQREHEILARQLTGRNEILRQQTLARLAANPEIVVQSLPTLIKTAEAEIEELGPDDSVPQYADRLLYVVGTAGEPDGDRMLVEMLDHENYRVAMIAADSLGQNGRQDTIEFLKKQVDRPAFSSHYGFRFNLVRALSLMHHPDAVEFLTQLEAELEGQLEYEVGLVLAEVTEEHFAGEKERYERWKATRKTKAVVQYASYESQPDLQEELQPDLQGNLQPNLLGELQPKLQGELQPEQPMPNQKLQRHYGIDIHAKRILFVIDRSSSMRKNAGELTRLELAKIELSKVIEEMPSDNEFGLAFFEEGVLEWQEHLVPATQGNKDAAMELVRRLGYGRRTNSYGALRESLVFDDQLEIVFFLSDGRPTCGQIIRPRWIVDDIIERNRLRHIKFNTIGISVSGESEYFLRSLAERSNGEFRKVN